MSQSAPPSLTKVFQQYGGFYRFVATSGVIRLVFLLVTSTGLTLWLASGQVKADFLFQSPQSPVLEVQPAPVEAPPPLEQPPAEAPPVEQAPVEQPPAQQPPAEVPPAEVPPAVEQPPAQSPPAAVAPTQPPPPADEPVRRNREEQPEADENAGPSNFVLDQAELIDSVVVTGAWVWLCCGILALLIVPLFFVVMYIRGRRKIVDQEGY